MAGEHQEHAPDGRLSVTKAATEFPPNVDGFFKYVELELWSRFESKLWKFVGAFLTCVTVAGFLGIPYYIRSEISSRLQEQAKTYSDRLETIAAEAKLIAILRSEFDSQVYAIRSEADFVIGRLEQIKHEVTEKAPKPADGKDAELPAPWNRMNDPIRLMTQLVSLRDVTTIAEKDSGVFIREVFSMEEAARTIKVSDPRVYSIEIVGFGGNASMSTSSHPVLDGTLGGYVADLKYRILVAASIKKALDRLNDDLLQIGGAEALDKRLASVKVSALEVDVSRPAFQGALTALSESFLTPEERKKFESITGLYVPGVAVGEPATAK